MSETAAPETTAPKAARPKVEKISVSMTDGRTVEFPVSRKILKEVIIENGQPVGCRFDFANGETRSVYLTAFNDFIRNYSACHGALQKIGDEWSGTMKEGGTLEDVVMTCDEMIERLTGDDGRWDSETRGSGDSLAGSSIIIKALVEVTKRDVAFVKAYLAKKLEEGKASGLTRQKLYASFRNPKSQTGAVIRRLEEEAAAKNATVDADAEVQRMLAAAAG